LATQWIALRRRLVSPKRVAQLIAIGLPASLFFLIPFAIVTIWLVLFWFFELIVYVVWKPFGKRPMNPPRIALRM
ncbi:MAG TPA: hypothetical protein VNC41_15580, partial [Acidimicrobiia bacterium]|nr:hypothetical protein [Acidimicrobiia bacterium]